MCIVHIKIVMQHTIQINLIKKTKYINCQIRACTDCNLPVCINGFQNYSAQLVTLKETVCHTQQPCGCLKTQNQTLKSNLKTQGLIF